MTQETPVNYFDVQLGKLVNAVFPSFANPASKSDEESASMAAIQHVLGENFPANLNQSEKFAADLKKHLAIGIRKHFASKVDKLASFLDALKELNTDILPEDSTLRTYPKPLIVVDAVAEGAMIEAIRDALASAEEQLEAGGGGSNIGYSRKSAESRVGPISFGEQCWQNKLKIRAMLTTPAKNVIGKILAQPLAETAVTKEKQAINTALAELQKALLNIYSVKKLDDIHYSGQGLHTSAAQLDHVVDILQKIENPAYRAISEEIAHGSFVANTVAEWQGVDKQAIFEMKEMIGKVILVAYHPETIAKSKNAPSANV